MWQSGGNHCSILKVALLCNRASGITGHLTAFVADLAACSRNMVFATL